MNTDMKLYGLSERWAALAAGYPGLCVGRILSQEKGMYRLVTQYGEKPAVVSGRMRHEAAAAEDYPAVGDFVMADWNESGDAVIHHLLPRRSCFARRAAGGAVQAQVAAANVDTVFLCMALGRDFSLRRLERYLSLAWDSGATPVVVLTKADLCDDPARMQLQAQSAAAGADVLVTSSMEENGCAQILPYLKPGKTAAFLGSSGVGKSTLINRLLGEERLLTQGVRDDERGRHTTTRRELFLLEQGGLVIDTPGMRELGMWDAASGIGQTFAEIERIAARCRFSDCSHQSEPGCAVRAAIEAGEIPQERWLSYLKLGAESGYVQDKAGYLAEKQKKFRQIALINKSTRKR